jgi:peptidyl-prolyl cis-trans isomerase B (cyclophilin B)
VATSRNRQRALARAKAERQIARRAAQARKRRQLQAGIGAGLAVVLVVLGIVWAGGGFDSKPKKQTAAAAGDCTWNASAANADDKKVGTPPTTGIGRTGKDTMVITTNQGVISGELDKTKGPCTVANFQFLAAKQYFDNTVCHRLTTEGLYVLQCGDPSGKGSGGPGYGFANEYIPPAPEPSPGASDTASTSSTALYPRGSIAMAHSSQPDSNGSQFFIVYKDTRLPAEYTLFGTVTSGLDVVEKIAAGGAVGTDGQPTGDGKPKIEVKIESLTVAPVPAADPSASPGTAGGEPAAASSTGAQS